MQEFRQLQPLAKSPIVSNSCFGGSRRPQRGSLNAPTQASHHVKAFMLFIHVMNLSPPTILQLLHTSKKTVKRGRFSVCMGKTCHDHLLWVNASSKDWTVGSSILHPTSELLIKFFYQFLPLKQKIIAHQRNRRANTGPLIGNRMLRRRHGCLTLLSTNRAFCMRKDVLSEIRPPKEPKLSK